ncbi:hypothetical protein ACTAQJ_14675 [Arthrobacter sp. alpha11c]
MPTTYEASGFMGAVIALIFVPFYAISLIFSSLRWLIEQILPTFRFPCRLPRYSAMSYGSLCAGEAIVVMAILYVGAVVMFLMAVRLFQHGSISYTSKVNIRNVLGKGRAVPAGACHSK